MSSEWKQSGDTWQFGTVAAEIAQDDGAFVITAFGSEGDIETAFAAIQAAMRFGKIRLRVAPETKSTIDQLTKGGRIKCAPTMGTKHKEVGVMGIKR